MCAEYFENPTMFSRVTAKNVGDVFFETNCTVCQSPMFLVANIGDLPDVINCEFREFAVAPLRPVHFLLPDQQSGMHFCGIQLLTPMNLCWT